MRMGGVDFYDLTILAFRGEEGVGKRGSSDAIIIVESTGTFFLLQAWLQVKICVQARIVAVKRVGIGRWRNERIFTGRVAVRVEGGSIAIDGMG